MPVDLAVQSLRERRAPGRSAAGSATSDGEVRRLVIQRPAPPITAAAAVRTPAATSTPRRLGPCCPSATHAGRACRDRGRCGTATTAPPRRRRRWRRRARRRATPAVGRLIAAAPATTTSTSSSPAPRANRRRARMPAIAASTRAPSSTDPTRIGLSLVPNCGDRPLLDRRRREVDDRRPDREHGRGGGVEERGDEVAGGHPHDGREHPEAGVQESSAHGWCSERAPPGRAVRQDDVP